MFDEKNMEFLDKTRIELYNCDMCNIQERKIVSGNRVYIPKIRHYKVFYGNKNLNVCDMCRKEAYPDTKKKVEWFLI